jgi:hypothetical protein
MKHKPVLLAGKIDWDWLDGEIAPLYRENGRPGISGAARTFSSLHVFAFKRDSAFVRRMPLHRVREPGTPFLGGVPSPKRSPCRTTA